ncbi:MAG TPA: DUF4430 domain-containing protein [Candidatus Elarobacter sp.]|nr:DUF4430 domain-containing protein [Candidatus Elarobacter sp.]
MSTVNHFVDWGSEFHDPPWQADDDVAITPGVTTVWDVLNSGALQPPLQPTSQGSGPSLYVTGIGGVSQNSGTGYYWVYFVNGQEPTIGAAAYVLNGGESIAWDYKHFSSRHKQATHPGF